MAEFDHKALLEEWVTTRTLTGKCLVQDTDNLITNLKTIQDHLCSFKSEGLTVVNVSATTFPQTLDWLHGYLLQADTKDLLPSVERQLIIIFVVYHYKRASGILALLIGLFLCNTMWFFDHEEEAYTDVVYSLLDNAVSSALSKAFHQCPIKMAGGQPKNRLRAVVSLSNHSDLPDDLFRAGIKE
ncbi:hypothetical protein PTKIN_Ptkin04bG0006300 [Pterospermum kingtungense]